jgi:hypothetical protein
MPTKTIALAVAAWIALPLLAVAQPQKSVGASVEGTYTIDAIDHDNRVVMLKDKDGNSTPVYCGPDMVKRFNELKVGDKVTFRYYESVVTQVRKAGDTTPIPKDQSGLTRGTGPRPGGTISQQQTASVTVKAIDPSVPSITVSTDTGRTMSFKIEDKKNIEGLKVDDKVVITYTQALVISVQ